MNEFEDYKNRVDQLITNQDDPLSIPPTVIGKKFKELAAITELGINSLAEGVINAEIGVAPAPNITVANVSVAGTYPYYGGQIVTGEPVTGDLSKGLVQFRKESGVWKKVIIPIPLGAYLQKETSGAQEIDTRFKRKNPGVLDRLYGPYANVAAACAAVPNTEKLVDGVMVNFREGQVVGIKTADGIVDYWWKKTYADSGLIKKVSEKIDYPDNLELIVGGFVVPVEEDKTLAKVIFGVKANGDVVNPHIQRIEQKLNSIPGNPDYAPNEVRAVWGIVAKTSSTQGKLLLGVTADGKLICPDFEAIKALVLGGGSAGSGDLSDADTKIIFGKNLFLVEGRPTAINAQSLIRSRNKNLNAYQFCIQSVNEQKLPLNRIFSNQSDLEYNRFGSTAKLSLRNTLRTEIHRLFLKVYKGATNKISTPRVQLTGDSLTDGNMYVISGKFAGSGVQPVFFGIRENGGTKGEGRAGWRAADFVYIKPYIESGNGFLPLPIGSEGGPTSSISQSANVFVRPALADDDPADVKNGYIYDYRFYLSRFKNVGRIGFEADPDIIVLNLCTNDINNEGNTVGVANALEGYRIMIKSMKSACPNVKIGLSFPQCGNNSSANLRWYNGYVPFMLEIFRLYGNRESEGIYIISSHAYVTDYFVFPLLTTGTTDPQNGEYTAAQDDITHYEEGQGKETYSEAIHNFIYAIA